MPSSSRTTPGSSRASSSLPLREGMTTEMPASGAWSRSWLGDLGQRPRGSFWSAAKRQPAPAARGPASTTCANRRRAELPAQQILRAPKQMTHDGAQAARPQHERIEMFVERQESDGATAAARSGACAGRASGGQAAHRPVVFVYPPVRRGTAPGSRAESAADDRESSAGRGRKFRNHIERQLRIERLHAFDQLRVQIVRTGGKRDLDCLLHSDQRMPVERQPAFAVLMPHRQRLQSEAGRDGIDERQAISSASREVESAGHSRIASWTGIRPADRLRTRPRPDRAARPRPDPRTSRTRSNCA